MTSPNIWVPGWSTGPTVFADVWATLQGSHIGCDFAACVDVSHFAQVLNRALLVQSEPVDLVGWSMGAMVALDAARHFPNRIKRLILISGSDRLVWEGAQNEGILTSTLDQMQCALHKNPNGVVNVFQRSMFTHDERSAGFYGQWRSTHGSRDNSPESLDAGLQYLRDFHIDPSSIRNETYMLHGDDDCIFPVLGAQRLAKAISSCELTVWPKVGHVPFCTNEERFKRWISSRLSG